MKNKPKRILVIRFSSLGDVVLTTPVFTRLRRRFPDAYIVAAVKKEFAEILFDHPDIDDIMAFDNSLGFQGLRNYIREIRSRRFDLMIDIHRSLRSRIILKLVWTRRITYSKDTFRRLVLIHLRRDLYRTKKRKIDDYLAPLRKLGIAFKSEPTRIHLSDENRASAGTIAKERIEAKRAWLAAYTDKGERIGRAEAGPDIRREKTIAIAPGAAHFLKKWPLEKYKELVYLINEEIPCMFYVFGGPNETECEKLASLPLSIVNFQGQLSIKQTAALISGCDLFIGNDSGLSHVAEAVGTDVFVLFGPTSEHFGYFPYRPGSFVFERPLSCRPCSKNGRGKCKNDVLKKCLNDISSRDVADRVIAYFNH